MTEFVSICTNIFQSSISRLDYKDNQLAVKTINSWVQTATNNKIFDIISSGICIIINNSHIMQIVTNYKTFLVIKLF